MNGAITWWRGRARFLLSAALLLWGCRSRSPVANKGSVTEDTNGSLVGRVLYADGSPARGAAIYARPASFLKDTASAGAVSGPDALTDSLGRYWIGALVPGAYRVEVRDGRGQAALGAGDVLPGYGLELDSQILAPVGALRGRVPTDSANPGRVTYVRIFGLDRVLRCDSTGAFLAGDLPAGEYQLDLVSSLRGLAFARPAPAQVRPRDTADLEPISVARFEDEDYGAWAHSSLIRVGAIDSVAGDTLRGYPLLVRLGASFDFASAPRREIRFADAQGRHLHYEIEQWDSAGRAAAIWVSVPALAADGGDPALTLYWGHPGAPDFSSGAEAFAAYAAVWHLGNRVPSPAAVAYPDASPDGATAEARGAPARANGAIGDGIALTGTQLLSAPDQPAFRPKDRISLSAWIKTDRVDVGGGEMIGFGNNYGLRLDGYGRPYFYLFNDSTYRGGPVTAESWHQCIADTDLRDGGWHHVAAVYDGAAMIVYVDGREKARKAVQGRLIYAFDNQAWMGRLGPSDVNHDFTGSLDETRIAPEVWSARKILMDYRTQRPGPAQGSLPGR